MENGIYCGGKHIFRKKNLWDKNGFLVNFFFIFFVDASALKYYKKINKQTKTLTLSSAQNRASQDQTS